jgi:hypothetical protein
VENSYLGNMVYLTSKLFMKQLFKILVISFFIAFYGCCDMLCERKANAQLIIQEVENYKAMNGQLPANLTELGLEFEVEKEAYYELLTDSTYSVWYGTSLGNSMVYDSKSKIWKEKG